MNQSHACTSPICKGYSNMCYTGTKCPEMTCCYKSVSADWSVTQTRNLKTQIGRGFKDNQFRLKFRIFLIFLLFSMNFWSWTFEFSVFCTVHTATSIPFSLYFFLLSVNLTVEIGMSSCRSFKNAQNRL
jgi:hypothetical protein